VFFISVAVLYIEIRKASFIAFMVPKEIMALRACCAQKHLPASLQSGVFEREWQTGGRGGTGDLLLKFDGPVDRDAVAVPLHGHAQGSYQTILRDSSRQLELLAVVSDHRRADPVNW
jgi:hypothetical protein